MKWKTMKVAKDLSDLKHKVVENYKALGDVVRGLRAMNYKVVMTIGSWDLLHIGHVRYLRKAKELGDFLIVGVDTDETVRLYKGDLRPIVPYEERCEMLTYQSCVDLVAPVSDLDKKGRWRFGLAKEVKPDVFVTIEESYSKKQRDELKKYCREVVVFSRQAERTSTTKLVQHAVKKHLDKMYELLEKRK